MADEKTVEKTIMIKRNGGYNSGLWGARVFKAGEIVKIIPGQKADFTKEGVSPSFVKTLKFNKHA